MDKNDKRIDNLSKDRRLDPAPTIQDNSIGDYYTRAQAILPEDRNEIRVNVPFVPSLLEVSMTSSPLLVLHQWF